MQYINSILLNNRFILGIRITGKKTRCEHTRATNIEHGSKLQAIMMTSNELKSKENQITCCRYCSQRIIWK